MKLIQLIKQENWDPNKIIDDYKKKLFHPKILIFIFTNRIVGIIKRRFQRKSLQKDTDKLKRYIAFFECFENTKRA